VETKTKQYQKKTKRKHLQGYKISSKENKMFKSFKIRRCHPVNLHIHNKQNLKCVKARNNDEKKIQNKKKKKSKKIVLFYIYKEKERKKKTVVKI
jgi:hypothetical protein